MVARGPSNLILSTAACPPRRPLGRIRFCRLTDKIHYPVIYRRMSCHRKCGESEIRLFRGAFPVSDPGTSVAKLSQGVFKLINYRCQPMNGPFVKTFLKPMTSRGLLASVPTSHSGESRRHPQRNWFLGIP